MSSLCFLQLMLGLSLFFSFFLFFLQGLFLGLLSGDIFWANWSWAGGLTHAQGNDWSCLCCCHFRTRCLCTFKQWQSRVLFWGGVRAFWWSYRGVLKRSSFFADVKFKNVDIKSRMHAGAAGGRVTPTAFTVCVHNRKEEGRGAFLIHYKKNHWWEFPCTWTCSDTPNSLLVYIQYLSLAYIQPQTQTVWPKTLTFTHATP